MLVLQEVLTRLREHRRELHSLGAVHLAIFGSVARGEATPTSDLDVLVDLDERTFDRYMNLKHYLEDLFETRVDLVLRDRLKPALREQILAESVDAA